MLIIIGLLVLTKVSNIDCNAGSVLFHKRSAKDCWTEDDLAKLRARKIFEDLMLPPLPPDKITPKYNKDTLRYFRKAMHCAEREKDPHTATILKETLADTLGGYMRGELLPNARFAYYAGYIPYRSVRQLHNYFEHLKEQLNTQGIGWKTPNSIPLQTNLTVGKILIGAGKPHDPCSYLIVTQDAKKCLHIPPPKVDDEEKPTALALPFKDGGFVSLVAPSSQNILLKYYTTAARCILSTSPDECRHSDFINFNNELWHWMKKYVAPHLMDEKLYAAYGGVLRIAAAVQNYGKGLTRRGYTSQVLVNEFENPNMVGNCDRPDNDCVWWQKLKDKTYEFNCEWSPQLYAILIAGAAFAICFMQLCYNYVFGFTSHCQCPVMRTCVPREVAYASVDSNFPAMLPSHTGPSGSEPRNPSHTPSKSGGTTGAKIQKVYDFNENTEKLMSVIMSDEDGTDSSSSEDSQNENLDKTLVMNSHSHSQGKPTSPPRIEAQIAQLKLDKTLSGEKTRQKYSASTVTQSEVTYCEQISDTPWSGSYSSDHSISSASGSKSHSQRSRRSRDLAWARKVVSKRTVNSQGRPTGPGINVTSMTSSQARR